MMLTMDNSKKLFSVSQMTNLCANIPVFHLYLMDKRIITKMRKKKLYNHFTSKKTLSAGPYSFKPEARNFIVGSTCGHIVTSD